MSLEELRAFLSLPTSLSAVPRRETAKRIPSGCKDSWLRPRRIGTRPLVSSRERDNQSCWKNKWFSKKRLLWNKTFIKHFLNCAWLDIRLRPRRHKTDANKFNEVVLRNASFHNRAHAGRCTVYPSRPSELFCDREEYFLCRTRKRGTIVLNGEAWKREKWKKT